MGSFPNIIYGDYGDEKTAQSTKIGGLPLETLMILPDGSKWRHTRAPSGTATVAGSLYQIAARDSDTMLYKSLIPAATYAVGATSVAFTTGGTTAITTDQYADGWLIIAGSAGSGSPKGEKYRIKSNNSAASGSTTCTLSLYPEDALKTAIPAGTIRIGVVANDYNAPVVTPTGTVLDKIVGVAPIAASAGFYYWTQRGGDALLAVGGTVLVEGEAVLVGTAEAGIGKTSAASGTASFKALYSIGTCVTVSLTNGFSLVNLELE